MPQGALNSPTKKPFYSLYEYLSSQEFENFQPSLGARFELARELARGFLQFHQLGWLHKNIRSQNFIFFPESEIASIKYPFILGFAYARPSEAGISDQAKVEDELKLYQHPKYRERAEKGYKLEYDVFSIGLLLFEIAKWRPLKTYFTRLRKQNAKITPETFASTLVEKEKDELEFRMGTHYATALLTCLNGIFGVQGEDLKDTSLKLAYFDKVVKNLAFCKA